MTTVQKTGSVGASWPPRYDSHNNRVKGFCTEPIGSLPQARRMFESLRQVEAESPAPTRTTSRAFVERGLTESIIRTGAGHPVEAMFGVSNALPGFDLVYFGRNRQVRRPHRAVMDLELSNVLRLAMQPKTDIASAQERISRNGYSVARLNGDGQSEVSRLVELYREAYQEYTFDISAQTVGDMLNNGNIVIVARDRGSQVVSAMVAEHVRLALDSGDTVHLYELSDYATFRSHRGNGLMTMLQMEAVRAIRALPHGPGSIIYAETRAAWSAVNRSAVHAGLVYTGTLPQHCVLVSDRDAGLDSVGRFEDLNVFHAAC